MQQATVNLFADMGVQPATLQLGLLPASASADVVPPVSDITFPADGASVPVGVAGHDPGNGERRGARSGRGRRGVGRRGADLAPGPGHASPGRTCGRRPTAAAYTVLTRAVDDSANLEAPGAGRTIVAGSPPPPPTGTVSIWADGVTPAVPNTNDPNAVEVGVKFRSATAGWITHIRFYKGTSNTGTHVGHLWSSTGTLLGTAAFVSETASGWQEAALAAPVAIAAGTTYVASYHTAAGYYASNGGYFAQGFTNGPLTALADGVDGGNGVYRYGASAFPNQTYQSENYWVDVVYTATAPGGPDTTPPTVLATTPANGATGVLATTSVSAAFSEALAPATVNGTTVELRDGGSLLVPATVSWNAATNSVVLVPTASLGYTATYTATVKGGAGGVTDVAGNPLGANHVWTFTTQAAPPPPPTGALSIWAGGGSPSATNLNDGQAIELGVKFRSSFAGWITRAPLLQGLPRTPAPTWATSGPPRARFSPRRRSPARRRRAGRRWRSARRWRSPRTRPTSRPTTPRRATTW